MEGGPNIFSHTYGPLIYNPDFDIDGSAVAVSGFLQASSPLYETDISYYGGSGVLSPSGMWGFGHGLGTSCTSGANDPYYSRFEFENKHLVSAVYLVDTSSPLKTAFKGHPIFGIFRWARSYINQFDLARYLSNNVIIKYHRNSDPKLFPRLKLKIDNGNDDGDQARNFLEPDHEYEITIKAHNSDISSTFIGGQTLGFWIRTEPEKNSVWSYQPAGLDGECGLHYDAWENITVPNLQDNGINIARNYAQTYLFPLREAESALFDPNLNRDEYSNAHCFEVTPTDIGIDGTDAQTIIKIGERTLDTFKFRFSTYNNLGAIPRDEYLRDIGKIHRSNQKYVLEFFAMTGHDTKFIVFEDISIKDLTNNKEYACIETNFGKVKLRKQDLKDVFRFFKQLQTQNASRNSTATSAVMEVSGGARMNYRSNIEMYPNVVATGYDMLTEVDIYEG